MSHIWVTNERPFDSIFICDTCLVRRLMHFMSPQDTGWQRLIGCPIFVGHFPQNSPIISGWYEESDPQDKASCGSSPPCKSCFKMQHTQSIWRHVTHVNEPCHTATHCNTLQHTTTHCNTPQHTATHCNTLQHTATHLNTLQHISAHCNILQCRQFGGTSHILTSHVTLQHTATHCNTL